MGTPVVLTKTDLNKFRNRLGTSITPMSPTGDVVFFDDFSNGLESWSRQNYNFGATPPLPFWSAARHCGSGFCAEFDTAANAGGYLQHNSTPYFLNSPYAGIEFGFNFGGANPKQASLNLTFGYTTVTGAYLQANINIFVAIQSVSFGQTNTYQQVGALVLFTDQYSSVFHKAKLVVDFIGGNYLYLIIDQNIIPLNQYPLQRVSTINTQPYVSSQFLGTGAAACSMYLGYYIETINEPSVAQL